MQAGNLTITDAMAYTSRVLVNGVQRPAVSWSVDRELAGDMPTQVVAGGGLTQATGSIEWAAAGSVELGGLNPWNRSTGWIPARGDRVEIFAGVGATEWKQFHGLVDKTTGSINGGFSSTIIDDYDKLSASVSHSPMLRIAPPRTDGGAYRGVGLDAVHYVDHALRSAGFYSTPRTEPNIALAVSCQGSMWPNSGTAGFLVSGTSFEGSGSHHSRNAAPWGYAVGNFNNTYTPRDPQLATVPVQLTAMFAPDHAGEFRLRAYYGANQLSIYGLTNKNVQAYVNGTYIVQLTAAQMAGATTVTLLHKNGVLTIRNDKGAQSSGSSSALGSAAMSSVVVTGDANTRVAGIQVSHPASSSQEFASLGFVPSARLDVSNVQHIGLLDAGRAIEEVRADDLLSEISGATLTGMWIDELGVLQWVPAMVLRDKAPAATVTTLNDILSLDWEDSILGTRSKVTVTGLIPAISKSRWRTQVVHRGSGDSLTSAEIKEEFISPAGDKDWGQVDAFPLRIGSGNWSTYNGSNRSMVGVFYSSSGETISDTGLTTTITVEAMGISTYKVTHTADTYPADVTANLATSPSSTDLWPRNRDKGLPRLNAFWQAQWADVSVTSTGAGGPGPELVHDCGWWNNRSNDNSILERIASYLAGQTANPKPTITGIEVRYDPRLQLGDVINIESPDLMGVSIRALIVNLGVSAGGDYTQTLSVRIISAVSTFTTYAEFNDSLPGTNLTYAQWQALGPLPETYAQFNTSL